MKKSELVMKRLYYVSNINHLDIDVQILIRVDLNYHQS